jgi:hypothetical protein
MAQIKSTIKLEMELSKQSWMDMIRTAGMRRRVLISVMLGLFTQMSGNTLLSYYSNLLFEMMSYTSSYAKTRINLANQCWSLLNGTIIALFITRFKRRHMFMLSSISMLLVFTSMTISFERLSYAKNTKTTNPSAAIAALFFYFAYSPCYNIGNNALTYSKIYLSLRLFADCLASANTMQPISWSFSPTLSELVVSVSNRCLERLAASSPPMSTHLP